MANFHITRSSNRNATPTTLWRTWDSFASDFDHFFQDFDRTLSRGSDIGGQVFSPAADVQESDKAYELSFDMPGFKSDEINIDLNGNTLTVTGERQRVTNDRKLHRSEKVYGEYRRSIMLPENIKADQIRASYENGVLSIDLPKAQPVQARKIEIGTSANKDSLNSRAQQGRADVEQQNLSH